MFADIISKISGALYGYILIIVLLAAGVYFTFRTGFAQFRFFPNQIRAVTERPNNKNGVSSFQALVVSTASRVGTGNIIGVSTAICIGGYGSVFWMWVIAIVGSASALIESTLAQIYKRKTVDGWCGGPAYYIETALKSRPLALVFTVCLIFTYGIGFNMLAAYNLQSTFQAYSFYDERYTPWIIGCILAVLVAFCLFGGGKRLIKVSGVLVSVMGIAYVGAALFIVILNIDQLPAIFSRIFSNAFDFESIFGGFSGSCLMYGIKRGLFSNEAGVGSAPNASASASVSHPVKQGLVQVLSVFIDTLLICTATAFMCMCSTVTPSEALSGAPYVQACMASIAGDIGPMFITVAMCLFAFTTLLGNLYYVDRSWFFMFKKNPPKLFLKITYVFFSLIILGGATLDAMLLWDIADIGMGVMTLINIPVIIIIGKYALRSISDYSKKVKKNKEITFKVSDISLPHDVDGWK